jgi:tetrahydromethanopterin S-methyltransferase subunit H
MANTFTVSRVEQGTKQFQGLFREMWAVTGSCSDIDAIADDVSVEVSLTVPGVALGDMVVGFSINKSWADANASVVAQGYVSAANTVILKLTNIDATADAFDADTWNNGVFKLLIGRPGW